MRSWQGHNAGDWRSDQEIGAFGFWDFKVPKAFRPQLFTRYPLTDQDSIYGKYLIVFWTIWFRPNFATPTK